MELHLHLSAAFRALDRKWGAPVDLETGVTFTPFDPAIVDHATETFSSECFLRAAKRKHATPTPLDLISCDIDGAKTKRAKVKKHDSFSNVSLARMQCSDAETSMATTETISIGEDVQKVQDSASTKKKSVFKHLKISLLHKKRKK